MDNKLFGIDVSRSVDTQVSADIETAPKNRRRGKIPLEIEKEEPVDEFDSELDEDFIEQTIGAVPQPSSARETDIIDVDHKNDEHLEKRGESYGK